MVVLPKDSLPRVRFDRTSIQPKVQETIAETLSLKVRETPKMMVGGICCGEVQRSNKVTSMDAVS